jgi:hypothetical protein
LVVFGEFALYALGESLELELLELVVDRAVEFVYIEAKALIRYGPYRVLARVLSKSETCARKVQLDSCDQAKGFGRQGEAGILPKSPARSPVHFVE